MNENIDLTKILKNCPRGTKFYSSVLNIVTYEGMSGPYGEDGKKRIFVSCNDIWYNFTPKGRMEPFFDGECVLFPSKEQRDWNKFTAAWIMKEESDPKKERFNPKTLKAFDRVLVRDTKKERWNTEVFSHIDEDSVLSYVTPTTAYIYCIPYNDDTKHLVGTKDEAPEYYRY